MCYTFKCAKEKKCMLKKKIENCTILTPKGNSYSENSKTFHTFWIQDIEKEIENSIVSIQSQREIHTVASREAPRALVYSLIQKNDPKLTY